MPSMPGEPWSAESLSDLSGKTIIVCARSRDLAAAARLWQESESLTGVRYEALAL